MIGLSTLSVSVHACELADIKTTWTYITAMKKFELELSNGCNCDAKNVYIQCMEGYFDKPGRRTKDFKVRGGGIIKAGEVVKNLIINDPFPGGVLHFEVKTVYGNFVNCK
ncbi:hypothetical protein SUGI_0381670 [Cryptomeria japonica]|nr:hypothetical protein SUGI_0381670 [Cryptomeria japonica]